jgi:hypothetical protein
MSAKDSPNYWGPSKPMSAIVGADHGLFRLTAPTLLRHRFMVLRKSTYFEQ